MKKRYLFVVLGFALTFFTLTNCVQYRDTTSVMLGLFPEARFDTIISGNRSLRYMTMQRQDTFPTIFFLHGSPSSMSVYNLYYEDTELATWTNIITADRPGYGYSGLGRSEKSVEKQARKMWKILEKEGLPRPLYLLGSSYGGTVAAKMAMLYPDRIDGVVLVSASLAPGLEHTYNISYLIQHPPFRWFVPRSIRAANDEKLSHRRSLEKMEPMWEQITAPVVFVYGTADKLIYPENATYAMERLVNSVHVASYPLEGEGHGLQRPYKDLILSYLQDMMKQNGHFILEPQQLAAEEHYPEEVRLEN
ncbi:MAG: alpha/beta hydrolase [Bacteroidales bacterium]